MNLTDAEIADYNERFARLFAYAKELGLLNVVMTVQISEDVATTVFSVSTEEAVPLCESAAAMARQIAAAEQAETPKVH